MDINFNTNGRFVTNMDAEYLVNLLRTFVSCAVIIVDISVILVHSFDVASPPNVLLYVTYFFVLRLRQKNMEYIACCTALLFINLIYYILNCFIS